MFIVNGSQTNWESRQARCHNLIISYASRIIEEHIYIVTDFPIHSLNEICGKVSTNSAGHIQFLEGNVTQTHNCA